MRSGGNLVASPIMRESVARVTVDQASVNRADMDGRMNHLRLPRPVGYLRMLE